MIYQMTITTETAVGTKTQTTTCYGDEDVAGKRDHYRTLAPRGATQTIAVKELRG